MDCNNQRLAKTVKQRQVQSSNNKFTAHEFKRILNSESPEMFANYIVRPSNKSYEFWQRDPMAIHLYSSDAANQKLDYIHLNRLAEHWQLASHPCHYKYSSARFYEYVEINDSPFLKDLRDGFYAVREDTNQGNEFEYKDGEISKRIHYDNSGVKSGYTEYYYTNGNLKTEEKYDIQPNGNIVLLTTHEYQYDDKINPFRPFKDLILPGKYTNTNNVVKETYTIHFDLDSGENVHITEYSYTYNADEYPLTNDGGLKFVY